MPKLIQLFSVVFCFSSIVSANETYNYPYQNPDVATLTASIMKSKMKDGKDVLKLLEVSAISGRNDFALTKGRGNFRYGYAGQKKSSQLVFILPDLGGTVVNGASQFLADHFYQNGFSVITLSSPFSWNFVLSSSQSTLPGLTDEDAADVYASMQLALKDVKSRFKPNFSRIGFVGLGLGGLEGAYIHALDKKEKKINIDRYLLINPIVDFVFAITEVENRASIALDLGEARVEEIKSKALNFVLDNSDKDVNDPKFFANLDKRFVLSNKEYNFLTGGLIHSNLADVILTSQIVKDLGILKSKANNWNERHKEAEALNFLDYFEKFVIPQIADRAADPLQYLVEHSNLEAMTESLKNDSSVFIMHNQDDFLVDSAQLNLLTEMVGPSRMKIYPMGGHLGNLWYSENQQDIINVFKH